MIVLHVLIFCNLKNILNYSLFDQGSDGVLVGKASYPQGHQVKIRAPGQSGHGPSYIEQLRTQNTIDNVDCGPCRALPGP